MSKQTSSRRNLGTGLAAIAVACIGLILHSTSIAMAQPQSAPAKAAAIPNSSTFTSRVVLSFRDEGDIWLNDNQVGRKLSERYMALASLHIKSGKHLIQMATELKLGFDLETDKDGQLTQRGQVEMTRLQSTLTSSISLSPVINAGGLNLFELRVSHGNAATADRMVNHLANNLVKTLTDDLDKHLEEMLAFFDSELNAADRARALAMNNLLRFKFNNHGFNYDDPIGVFEQSENAKVRHWELENENDNLRAKIDFLKDWIDDQPDFVELKKADGTTEESPNVEKIKGQKEFVLLSEQAKKLSKQLADAATMKKNLEEASREFAKRADEHRKLKAALTWHTKKLEYWENKRSDCQTMIDAVRQMAALKWRIVTAP